MTKKLSTPQKDFVSTSFRFEGDLHEQFMSLVAKTKSSSQMEFLRRSLMLTSIILEAQESGETLVLKNKATGSEREVLVLW